MVFLGGWVFSYERGTPVERGRVYCAHTTCVGISYANTYNLQTWFQSKLLYFYITNEDRSV